MTDHKKQFDSFWDLYPKRNGKRIGKYPCQLWFKAEKPDEETFIKIIDWLNTDNNKRRTFDGKFYANLPDPIRFLRNRMWLDPIEAKNVSSQPRPCYNCGKASTILRDHKRWCSSACMREYQKGVK